MPLAKHQHLELDPATSARLGKMPQRGTSIEKSIRCYLHSNDLRFRTKNTDLPGSPRHFQTTPSRRFVPVEPTASLTVLKKLFRRIESVSLTVPTEELTQVRCPTRCSGADRGQTKINREKLVAAGLSGEWLTSAWMCQYCGCVYSDEWDRNLSKNATNLPTEILEALTTRLPRRSSNS